MTQRLQRAIARWERLVGAEHVIVDADVRQAYCRSTLAHRTAIPAIVRPASAEEVQAVVRVAAEDGIAVYPISRGKNWGYGSRSPVAETAVILDLGRMNRIIAYDPELAYVTVEPGVTQQQLVDFLAENGRQYWADTTSVTPEASVLGNAVERGHGLTAFADHADHIAGLEVVLGNGQLLRTGHGRFSSASAEPLDRFGAGPALEGLFTQSSFGVVTKGSIWLMPAPEAVRAVVLDPADDAEFFELVPRLRELRLRGLIPSGPRFANVFRGLMFQEYPWALVPPGGVLSKDAALQLAKDSGRGAWRVSFAVYGPHHELEARIKTIRGALDSEATIFDPLDASSGEAQKYRVLASLLTGQLMGGGAASMRTYWRKRERPQGLPDPDRDRCGVMWLAPVTPFRSEDIAAVQRIVEDVLPRHGFEPDLSMYCLRPRALHFHISIIYDRDEEGADAKAQAAHDEVLKSCIDLGYPPHRLGVQSMFAMGRITPTHEAVLRGLKNLFDPAGILSPGRYMPP